MAKFIIYTDGGSRGNPGVAGCGAVVADASNQVLKKASKALGTATNNEAEYQAVILGLETLKKIISGEKLRQAEVEVKMDSQLVASQLAGTYQLREERLFPFFIKIWNYQVKDFPKIKFTYIPRAQNSLADGLANEAMDGVGDNQNKLLDF
ncbi:MAG: ribonuclease HI family protein [Candidatus Paceibacterota bacterium]|jgi:ribonuclease HI